jgi:hypothetical protein
MNQNPIFSRRMMTQRLEQLRLRETPRRAKAGLREAGWLLLVDSVTLEPKAPVDTTSLIGSASVFVDGDRVRDSPYGVPGTESRYDQRVFQNYRAYDGEEHFVPNTHIAEVVFNAPYAAEQHEKWPNKFESGAGMHYISTKIGTYITKYLDAIYEAIFMGDEGNPDPNRKV